jgi:hypothetical protein
MKTKIPYEKIIEELNKGHGVYMLVHFYNMGCSSNEYLSYSLEEIEDIVSRCKGPRIYIESPVTLAERYTPRISALKNKPGLLNELVELADETYLFVKITKESGERNYTVIFDKEERKIKESLERLDLDDKIEVFDTFDFDEFAIELFT